MSGIIAPLYVTGVAGAGVPLIVDMMVDGGGAFSGYSLDASGDIIINGGSGWFDSGDDWISPKVGMSGFEGRATLTGGNVTLSSLLNTWINLGASPAWRCRIAGIGDTSAELTIEIRPVGGVTVTSATISLTGTNPEDP